MNIVSQKLSLTHLPLVSHICVSESVNIGSDNGLLPIRLSIGLRNKLQWNFNQIKKLFIHENISENNICEMAAILSRERWVKSNYSGFIAIGFFKIPWHLPDSLHISLTKRNNKSVNDRFYRAYLKISDPWEKWWCQQNNVKSIMRIFEKKYLFEIISTSRFS